MFKVDIKVEKRGEWWMFFLVDFRWENFEDLMDWNLVVKVCKFFESY